jgi:hypothetical protein
MKLDKPLDATYTGRAHYKAADISSEWNNRLGIPVIITTAIVGTAIFATLSSNPDITWKIVAGIISLLAATLSALQTFFKFAEAMERHRTAGAAYGAIRRDIELFLLKYSEAKGDARSLALQELERLTSKLSELASGSPRIPDRAFHRAVREIEGERGKLPTSVAKIHENTEK